MLRLINDLCLKAIHKNVHAELSAWRLASKTVDTNKGHQHERQLAAEGSIPSSTIYEVLSRKLSRKLLPVHCAVGKEFEYCPRIA